MEFKSEVLINRYVEKCIAKVRKSSREKITNCIKNIGSPDNDISLTTIYIDDNVKNDKDLLIILSELYNVSKVTYSNRGHFDEDGYYNDYKQHGLNFGHKLDEETEKIIKLEKKLEFLKKNRILRISS